MKEKQRKKQLNQKCGCKNPDKGFLRPKINFIFYRKKDPSQGRELTSLALAGILSITTGDPEFAINRQPHAEIICNFMYEYVKLKTKLKLEGYEMARTCIICRKKLSILGDSNPIGKMLLKRNKENSVEKW